MNKHEYQYFSTFEMLVKGYGNISPSTDKGKLFCIAFTVIGKYAWHMFQVLVSGQIIKGSLDAK